MLRGGGWLEQQPNRKDRKTSMNCDDGWRTRGAGEGRENRKDGMYWLHGGTPDAASGKGKMGKDNRQASRQADGQAGKQAHSR